MLSNVCTRSFTLAPLSRRPAADDATDVGRRVGSPKAVVGRGILDGLGGAGCRWTSSLGWMGFGRGLGAGVLMGARAFWKTSGGGIGRTGAFWTGAGGGFGGGADLGEGR